MKKIINGTDSTNLKYSDSLFYSVYEFHKSESKSYSTGSVTLSTIDGKKEIGLKGQFRYLISNSDKEKIEFFEVGYNWD